MLPRKSSETDILVSQGGAQNSVFTKVPSLSDDDTEKVPSRSDSDDDTKEDYSNMTLPPELVRATSSSLSDSNAFPTKVAQQSKLMIGDEIHQSPSTKGGVKGFQSQPTAEFSPSQTSSSCSDQHKLSSMLTSKKVLAGFLILAVGGLTVALLGIPQIIALPLAAIIGIGAASGVLGGYSTYRLFKGSNPQSEPLLAKDGDSNQHGYDAADGTQSRMDVGKSSTVTV
ncbi:MAG: hypothetical protein GKR77_02965 [Legionellales bacterium]|nr:hypothetical protein [Legionellales bacterium]